MSASRHSHFGRVFRRVTGRPLSRFVELRVDHNGANGFRPHGSGKTATVNAQEQSKKSKPRRARIAPGLNCKRGAPSLRSVQREAESQCGTMPSRLAGPLPPNRSEPPCPPGPVGSSASSVGVHWVFVNTGPCHSPLLVQQKSTHGNTSCMPRKREERGVGRLAISDGFLPLVWGSGRMILYLPQA
jgi:hypothetical protein